METIVLLVAVVAGLVALELLGMHAYRRYRARRQAAFTRENVGAVYDDLQAARTSASTWRRVPVLPGSSRPARPAASS